MACSVLLFVLVLVLVGLVSDSLLTISSIDPLGPMRRGLPGGDPLFRPVIEKCIFEFAKWL